MVIYKNPGMFSRVKRAWAVWVLANMSYCAKLNGFFGRDATGKNTTQLAGKRKKFTEALARRLEHTLIESSDALSVIASFDKADAFFFCDPPYPGTAQAHYKGYNQQDFEGLLSRLSKIRGKFMLCSFRNGALSEYADRNGWHIMEYKMVMSGRNLSREKIEVVTVNYEAEEMGLLFAAGGLA